MIAPEIPTAFIGLCDQCLSVKTFATQRERDLWESYHPHQEAYGDDCR